MASDKLIDAIANPALVQRVAYMALRTAHEVATEPPETENHALRMAYAETIFRGEDKVLLLALHLAAAEPAIADALVNGTEVQDLDMENALKAVWNVRAAAYGSVNYTLQHAQKIVIDAHNIANEAITQAREAANRASEMVEKMTQSTATGQ